MIAAAFSYFLLTLFLQATLERVILIGKFSDQLTLTTTSVNYFNATNSSVVSFDGKNGKDPIRVGSGHMDSSASRLRFEFEIADPKRLAGSEKPSYVNIYSIELVRPFSDNLVISQRRFPELFSSEQFLDDGSGVLQLDPGTGKATMESKVDLVQPEYIKYSMLSLLVGLAVFLLLRQVQWAQFPAFRDMGLGSRVSTTHEFDVVNGVRGLAAILVLLSHTAPGFYNIKIGLALLFVLSGFLLSKPFVINPQKIFSWRNLEQYLVKRLRRILPMYYLFVFVSYVFTLQLEDALKHFLFIQAGNHLWPMTQIFTFYMLLPVILLITCGLHRVQRFLPLVFLLAATLLYIEYASEWTPYYNGRFSIQFFLYAFLMGVLASYIQYGFIANSTFHSLVQRFSLLFGALCAAYVILTILWAGPLLPPESVRFYFHYFPAKCALCAILVIFVVNADKTWFAKVIGNWLFRSVGVVGFSFYLLHGLGMDISTEFQSQILGLEIPERSWWFSLSAFIITYWMALITYSYVERPFFGVRHQSADSR